MLAFAALYIAIAVYLFLTAYPIMDHHAGFLECAVVAAMIVPTCWFWYIRFAQARTLDRLLPPERGRDATADIQVFILLVIAAAMTLVVYWLLQQLHPHWLSVWDAVLWVALWFWPPAVAAIILFHRALQHALRPPE